MSGKATVFVTGGSGFVGKHVVRRLVENGYHVRMLRRRAPDAGVPASVEVVTGNLTDPPSYAAALAGASAVIHAALTDDLSRDVEATVALRDCSAQAGIRKFVHLSTISVYGNPLEGIITEETPPLPVKDSYAETKLAIEQRLREPAAIEDAVILRLGCVYGPGGGWWTDGLLNLMRQGRLIQVDGGRGIANLIHVLDIAALIPTLLSSNAAVGVFNLTDGRPVTWSRYFAELEKLLGRSATVSMSEAEARAYGKKWLQPSLPRRVLRRLQGRNFIHPLDDRGIAGFVSRAVYSNEKAVRSLGFRPAFDLEPDTLSSKPA
jgi:nucleoside-diphosphate-sugar epimerase